MNITSKWRLCLLLLIGATTSSGNCYAGGLPESMLETNSQSKCSLLESSTSPRHEKFPWELLKEEGFKRAYLSLLGGRQKDTQWLSLSGPAPRSKLVKVNDHEYLYVWSCKQHECNKHVIHLIFSADAGLMYGLLMEDGKSTWLGSPPLCIQKSIKDIVPKNSHLSN